MSESKTYPPSHAFASRANVSGMEAYREMYARARHDPGRFWGDLAHSELSWFTQPLKTLEWDPPFAKWFSGGRINACYNCVDRHLTDGRKAKPAILWEGEPAGDQRSITYEELHHLVTRFANALRHLGLRVNDRVIIYMPMIPELAVAMLACARLGIIHSVVFGGFSSEALKTRIDDLNANLVLTADAGQRRGREIPLKRNRDAALAECPGVRHSIVYRHKGAEIAMREGRDHWWHDLMFGAPEDCPAEALDSEHPLYVLYTSGT